ncbi:MAG: hypothetical protein KKD44_16135 [Proteobacteria bacterium]|nr:hypothetical protein [Pseudomonadota bacterium]
MIRCTAKALCFWMFILCLFSSWAHAEYIDDFKKRAKSIYLLHTVKHTARTKNVRENAEKRKAIIHERADSAHLEMLSYIPPQSMLLPFDDVQTIISRIELLTKKIETTKEGEQAQRMKFDMAYEYFLLYLHYLHEKYGLTRSSELSMYDEIPVTDKELEQYLSLSEYYLKSFLSENPEPQDVFVQGKTMLRATDDVSFRFRKYKNLYLNVYFLAMMLECEKLSGEWGDTSQSAALSSQYDKKTWNWLDNLWKRHFKASRETAAYTPSSQTLFTLYELYMRYHFFGRYLRHFNENDPLLDSQTRTLLNRLYALQKEANLGQKNYYAYYMKEATNDSNNTDFLVNLYLARRGYFATRDLNFSFPKYELFELYHKLYDDAASSIKYNITYRSTIYNELILFGIGIDNLRLMEDVLYEYGLLSMRLQENDGKSINKIKYSSRLTMAYLLANILDKKRRSGLDQNSDEYRDIAETLTPILISKKTNYWEYASVIHSALAMFYSRKEGTYNESLAMYHAKRAFIAPCEKVSLSYGTDKNGWMNFFELPGAESYLKLFLEFQKKYQTSPDAVMPREFRSDLIIRKFQTKQNN